MSEPLYIPDSSVSNLNPSQLQAFRSGQAATFSAPPSGTVEFEIDLTPGIPVDTRLDAIVLSSSQNVQSLTVGIITASGSTVPSVISVNYVHSSYLVIKHLKR